MRIVVGDNPVYMETECKWQLSRLNGMNIRYVTQPSLIYQTNPLCRVDSADYHLCAGEVIQSVLLEKISTIHIVKIHGATEFATGYQYVIPANFRLFSVSAKFLDGDHLVSMEAYSRE